MTDHVEVTGTGSAGAVPDVVVLDLRVQAEEADVGDALARAAERTRAVLDAAGRADVPERDRRTTGLAVHARWDREAREVLGHTAVQTLRLQVRDRDRVGDLLAGLAVAAGDGFGLDAVSLEVADPAPLHERARAAAFADARARAEQFAALAARSLGPVLRVREGGAMAGPAPRMRMAAHDAAGGMPLAAGESEVTASVVVRFALAPA
jgi:uncharacterized protein YggE